MDDGQIEGSQNGSGGKGGGTPLSQVIPIGEGKKTRHKKLVDTIGTVACFRSVLSGNPTLWPVSPRKFETLVDPRGVRTFVEILPDNVCRYVAIDAPVAELVRYSIQDLGNHDPKGELEMPWDKAKKLVQQWAATRDGFDLKQVQPVREKSEPGLCWHRLGFDLAPGNTPTFDELFSKASNVKAIMQWIGSLFDPDSPRQQYIFLWGDGLDGKGSLIFFLEKIFVSTFSSQGVATNQFWTHGLLGKRVVALDDVTEKELPFLTSSVFKSLTGGGTLRVEEKGGAISDGEFICKIIVTSNHKPSIERSRADLRRIIYSEFQAREVAPTDAFKKTLVLEAPAFLWKCREAYRELGPGEWIRDDKEILDLVLDDRDERFHTIFEKWFRLGEGKIKAGEVRFVLEKEKMLDKKEQGRFRKYLERKFWVKKKQGERGGTWYYFGLEFRPEARQGFKQLIENATVPNPADAHDLQRETF